MRSRDIVRLTDERGRVHGRAFYSDKSQIADPAADARGRPVDRAFFTDASGRPSPIAQRVVENTDAFRIVYSEADCCRR